MMNPNEKESMIDTAVRSCGFPVHNNFRVWKNQLREMGLPVNHVFTLEQKPPLLIGDVNEKYFRSISTKRPCVWRLP